MKGKQLKRLEYSASRKWTKRWKDSSIEPEKKDEGGKGGRSIKIQNIEIGENTLH